MNQTPPHPIRRYSVALLLWGLGSTASGFDDTQMVSDVLFENPVVNGVVISDEMAKPAWYKTSDLARIFVGEHVEGLVFRSSTDTSTP